MDVDIKQYCAGVDWKAVSDTLKCVGMAYHELDVRREYGTGETGPPVIRSVVPY